MSAGEFTEVPHAIGCKILGIVCKAITNSNGEQQTFQIGSDLQACATFIRARHLLFPQLGSRTTIKQYGLVRNRNLLGHDDNILPFSIKKWGELYICIFNLISRLLCLKHTVTS